MNVQGAPPGGPTLCEGGQSGHGFSSGGEVGDELEGLEEGDKGSLPDRGSLPENCSTLFRISSIMGDIGRTSTLAALRRLFGLRIVLFRLWLLSFYCLGKRKMMYGCVINESIKGKYHE